ncbi:MAG: S8 family serine peptidase [Nitrospirota bacterium]|nr:S8 family serine peptidase [Nitrospirota bacterium]
MGLERFFSRRQFLKASVQTITAFTLFKQLLSSSAIADDALPPLIPTPDDHLTLRPVMDLSLFPDQLSFSDGTISVRDQTRLLLFFWNQPHSAPLLKDDVVTLLKPAGLVLEDDKHVSAGETSTNRHLINHGPRRFWVRSKNKRPITRGMLKALEDEAGGKLERIGPAYQSPGSKDRSGLYCPLPHVLLIKPQPKMSDKDLQEFFTSFHLIEISNISVYLNGYRYLVLRDQDDPAVYDLFQRLVRHEPNIIQSVLFDIMPLISPLASTHDPDDFLYPRQWSMTRIAAGAAASGSSGWVISQGDGIIVAIVDKGCDLTHPDLRFTPTGISEPSSGATFDFPGDYDDGPRDWCLPGDCPGPVKDGGPIAIVTVDPQYVHGTKMAGIIGALHNNGATGNEGIAGVAGQCSLMSLMCANASIAERAVAIAYAATNGAKVINYSIAEGQDTWANEPYTGWKPTIDSVIRSAAEQAVICAATGNYASTESSVRYPAQLDESVIACGASQDIDMRRPSSQYGAGLSVVAPGGQIVSTTIQGQGNLAGTYGGTLDYESDLNGTSEATAHVSGLAAMIRSKFPSLGSRAVRSIIERTAGKVHPDVYPYRYRSEMFPSGNLRYPSGPWNEQVGYGRINCHHALTFSDVCIKDYSSDTGVEPSSPPAGENFWSTSGVAIRPSDDGVFQPDDPLQSSIVTPGQDNVVYVQILNRGPALAPNFTVKSRLVRYAMTEFTLHDWTKNIDPATDPVFASEHIELSPTNPTAATFSNVAAGASVLAKFVLPKQDVDAFFTNLWHPCILAHVDCSTDYASLNHRAFATTSPQVLLLNNFAQRNVTVASVSAGQMKKFPFMIGNPAATSARIGKAIEIIVERTLRSKAPLTPPGPQPLLFPRTPARLSLDVDRSLLPAVKLLAPLEAITGRRRKNEGRIGTRSFDFDEASKRFRILPLEAGSAMLSLETEIPKTARPGDLFQTDISQLNRHGEVLGGVTVIYHVME